MITVAQGDAAIALTLPGHHHGGARVVARGFPFWSLLSR
jgi:hypothetical protein